MGAIISTIGEIDSYQLPDAKGYTAFQRHVIGISDEQRQKSRDEILSTTQEDFRRFAEFLETVKGPAGRVVASRRRSPSSAPRLPAGPTSTSRPSCNAPPPPPPRLCVPPLGPKKKKKKKKKKS